MIHLQPALKGNHYFLWSRATHVPDTAMGAPRNKTKWQRPSLPSLAGVADVTHALTSQHHLPRDVFLDHPRPVCCWGASPPSWTFTLTALPPLGGGVGFPTNRIGFNAQCQQGHWVQLQRGLIRLNPFAGVSDSPRLCIATSPESSQLGCQQRIE